MTGNKEIGIAREIEKDKGKVKVFVKITKNLRKF